ncbi:MAG: dihydroxyacetone kinase subunit DhaK [Acidobacteriaceae bacterium]|nr:dihydroxyacetone kinase subunit DhaK [Acidobacteriaceae bacterium]
MKKLINQPEHVVSEMCDGFTALYPAVSRLGNQNVLLRSDCAHVRDLQVALISGGGSGHEPAHAGYIGQGMLSAAVAGEVFTSPPTASVLSAIRAVAGKPGALLIVKNYTGDRLNFGLAAEMARAEGTLVETVIVADDVALAGSEQTAGRRGIAGTVLIHKIAGAAAAEGKDLPQVASVAQAAAENVGTMGVSLSAGISPVTGKPSFTLAENEIELGLGIHGEPGVRRISLRPAAELADELLSNIITALRLRSGERIAVLINNLGATTNMELAVVARRALASLHSRGLLVERIYAGAFMTSLDMAGVSVSLLRLDEERLRLLDAPTTAPAWPNVLPMAPAPLGEQIIPYTDGVPVAAGGPPETPRGRTLQAAVDAACKALIEAETRLTEMDRIAGDGDLGINMARAAGAIKERLSGYPFDNPPQAFKALGHTLQDVLGGSSGPLYGVLFIRLGNSLEGSSVDDPNTWALACLEAANAVSELGGAAVGDRTMLDALIPFTRTFYQQLTAAGVWKAALQPALASAEAGAESTARMTARRGRSSYLGERILGVPDPGAIAVAIWLRAAVSALAE